MKLTKELVVELATIKAQKAELDRREKQLVPKIKAKMETKGLATFAPTNCPFKLVLNTFNKSHVSWKDEWRSLAKRYVPHWKKKETKLIEDSKEEESQLTVEPNETYTGDSE